MVGQAFPASPLSLREQWCNILDRGRGTGEKVDLGVFAGGVGNHRRF
jgi:hypothetical protein